jgi:hypothetical protein
MKKLLIVGAALLIAITSFADQQDFEVGFKAGWAAGYQHVHGQFAIILIAPIPGIAGIGRDNYNEGFIAGEQAVQGY